jgi:microcystin-dependent protein
MLYFPARYISKQKLIANHSFNIKYTTMTPYLGMIGIFGFNFAPLNWALCQGQVMSIQQNTALFSLLGTNFGGNGQTTFGLPDFSGNFPIGTGSGPGLTPYVVGDMGGSTNYTLTSQNMPMHVHGLTLELNSNAERPNSADPTNRFPGIPENGNAYAPGPANVVMGSPVITVGETGGLSSFSIQAPSLVMNYCIALQGIFPQRS